MDTLLDLRFKVGILGFVDSANADKISKQINAILHEIRIRAEDYNKSDYGFNGNACIIDLYTSPIFSDDAWVDFYNSKNSTINLIIPNREMIKDNRLVKNANSITNLNVGINNLGTVRSMINWITSQIDIAVLIWDGDEYSNDGHIWSFIEECKHKEIPCIWIDSKNEDNIFWFRSFYHEKYSSEYLREYVKGIYDCIVLSEEISNDHIFLSALWGKVYNKFTGKYKILNVNDKRIVDVIIEKDYILQSDNEKQRNNYSELKKAYINYDIKALSIAKNYRESVYFRSILPFISTIFLAIGFYIETILGFVSKLSFSTYNIWTIIAGFGFLLQAAINCYAYYMWEDKNKAVKIRKNDFLNCRYVAEYFRNAIHFVTFGIPVKETKIVKNSFSNNSKIGHESFCKIHHILRSLTPTDFEFNKNVFNEVIDNLLLMIDDQIGYHKDKKEHMDRIAKGLSKLGSITFWVGFIFVTVRGSLQFVLAVIDKSNWIKSNGIALDSFIRSFSNMLALVLPAWASYFTSKLTMNNFDGLSKHSSDAFDSLKELKKKVGLISQSENITYEMLYSLSEDVLMHQINELNDWYAQTAARTILKL